MNTYPRSIAGIILILGLSALPAHAAVTNDTTFGNFNGTATISQGGMISDTARDIAVDADGKIVLVGYVDQPPVSATGNNHALAVARLTAGGLPDNSFSGDGKLFMSTCAPSANGPGGTWLPKVALQADGKILVGATCVGPTYEQIVVVRFLTDGTLDDSFDGDGILYLPAPTADIGSRFGDIAVQSDGRILVAGTEGTMNANVRHGVVRRLGPAGAPDATFGTQGKYTGGDGTHFDPLAVMADGRIVVAGYTSQPGVATTDVVVTRLTSAGAPDSSFGTQGVSVRNVGVLSAPIDPDFATMDFANAVVVRPDGRVLVGGSSRDSLGLPRYEPLVMQLTTRGALDSGWGQSGYIGLGGVPGDPAVLAMYLLPAGDLLLGGNNMPFTHVDSAGLARSNDSVPRFTTGIAVQNGKAVISTALGTPSFDFRAMRFDFTADSDLVPDLFGFGHGFVRQLGLPEQSETVLITGIPNASADVSIVNGEFSIACTGTFVPAGETRLIQNNTSLCLRHTNAELSNTTVTSTLTVGGTTVDWSSTTGDGSPDGLAFTNQANVAVSTVITSATVTVTGINMPIRIMISGGEHSIGCTGTYSSVDATIINNQTLCLRHTSAATASTTTTTNVKIGDLVTTFTSTTAAPPPPPSGGGASGGGGGGGGALDAWLLAALLGLLFPRLTKRPRKEGAGPAYTEL